MIMTMYSVDSSLVYSLQEIYDECCQVRCKSILANSGNNSRKWITKDIKICIRRKHYLFRQYKCGSISLEYYNMYKNKLLSIIRKCKRKYYDVKFRELQNNISATWREINSLTGRKVVKQCVRSVNLGDREVTDPTEIADVFCNYFANIAERLDNAIPASAVSPLQYMGERTQNSMFAEPATAREVQQVISQLPNKLCGINNLPVFIFKILKVEMSTVIANLFNESLDHGRFPKTLKVGRITPIYKSGDKTKVNNYRPISSLPILSKIFEKLMCRRLLSFINSNDLLCEQQFGFRKFLGTSEAITEFLDGAYGSLDDRKLFCAIFLDFSKAFDTVNHRILSEKLDHIGIRGNVCSWFTSYLSSREQYVSIADCVSSRSKMTMGVPQGSILGPILFLVYINDMSSCSELLNFIHFADDTTVSLSRTNSVALAADANAEMDRLREWLCANRLSLNVDKTCYMLISDFLNVEDFELNVAGRTLSRISHTKFLGITIDDRLSFGIHADIVCRSASRGIGMLRRVSSLISYSSRRSLYYALIYSKVSYGVIAWGLSRQDNINRIERLLKKARSYVSNDRTDDCLNFLSINKYFICQKMYKVTKLNRHPYFFRLLEKLTPVHRHGTRFANSRNFNTPSYTKSKCQKSFLFQSVRYWNELPDIVRESSTALIFNRRLKAHLLANQ